MEDNHWISTPKDTGVWLHIERHKTNTDTRCKLCKKVFKGSWTSTLRYHLEKIHGLEIEKTESKEKTAKGPQCSQPSISTMFRAKTDDAGLVLARLCALDRIPFATIAKSKDIMAGLKARGLKIPESDNGIRNIVFQFYVSIKEKLKTDIAEKIKNDERFSISLDEYTLLNNRRYMCINLHDERHVATSLGMVRVAGSMPAEKAVQLIDERLLEFNLKRRKHIVGVISDGAAVMKKTGRLLEIEHQLCHSHGSHLAVCDLLYKDSEDSQADLEDNGCDGSRGIANKSGSSAAVDREEIENVEESGSCDEEDEVADEDEEEEERTEDTIPVIAASFRPIINKIRGIVKIFRRSPVKNDTLQKYVLDSHSKELNLIVDCKTRWNSLLAMLRRFHLLKGDIQKALVDHSQLDVFLSAEEEAVLQDLIDVLETLELGTVSISANDYSILDADRVFEFMLQQLKENPSDISQKMYEILDCRFEERRNKELAGVLFHLSATQDSALTYPTKTETMKTIRDLYARLFWSNTSSVASSSTPEMTDTNENDEPAPKKSKGEQLKEFLETRKEADKDKTTKTQFSSSHDILMAVKREFSIYETTGDKPSCLEKVFRAVSSMPPTSVEAERAFSAAGLFVTKMRSRLSDRSIDVLCFLRNYLLKLQN